MIRNSIQADSNLINIECSSSKDTVDIMFSDNGTGISTENLSRVFEVNFSTKTHGMGIGLSMAKKTIENISGSIELVKSSSEGTMFKITLPLI